MCPCHHTAIVTPLCPPSSSAAHLHRSRPAWGIVVGVTSTTLVPTGTPHHGSHHHCHSLYPCCHPIRCPPPPPPPSIPPPHPVSATTSPSIYTTTPSSVHHQQPVPHHCHGLGPVERNRATIQRGPQGQAQLLSQQSRGWAVAGLGEASRGDCPSSSTPRLSLDSPGTVYVSKVKSKGHPAVYRFSLNASLPGPWQTVSSGDGEVPSFQVSLAVVKGAATTRGGGPQCHTGGHWPHGGGGRACEDGAVPGR